MIQVTELFSPELDRSIRLRLYTPPGYEEGSDTYPVAYFFDGQNLFDRRDAAYGMIWEVDQTLEKLDIPMIVVGLDSGDDPIRTNEYSPWKFNPPRDKEDFLHLGGQGDLTARHIVETLIPWVEANYRTTDTRLIGGASLGGVMSLYTGLSYPELFRYILAMSTASWVFQEEFHDFLQRAIPLPDQRIYLDVGTQESSDMGFNQYYLEANQAIYDWLEQQTVAHRYIVDEGGRHNEDAWARRLPEALEWLLERKEEPSE